MAKNQPPKKPKKVGKNTMSRGRVAKGATRSRVSSQRINELRLEQDKRFYNENVPYDVLRHTTPTPRYKYGYRLIDLEERDTKSGRKVYVSTNEDIIISKQEYDRYAYNASAIPMYTPIHKRDAKGKKRIVAYRNSITHETVTPYYKHKYYDKYFNVTPEPGQDLTEEENIRSNVYNLAVENYRTQYRIRENDLISTYALVHPEYVTIDKKGNEHIQIQRILRDGNFQALVMELEQLHTSAYGITQQNIALTDELMGSLYDKKRIRQEQKLIKQALASNPRYAEVLVELGRRTPTDTKLPGESDPDHIKNVVRPYYADMWALKHAEDYEE